MIPRDLVRAQISHCQTETVPYTLPFEDTVGQRLDDHYGNTAWRNRLVPYIVGVGAVDTDPKERIDGILFGDDWGDKITFWGCLGSQSTISFGTPETPMLNAAAVVEAFEKTGRAA